MEEIAYRFIKIDLKQFAMFEENYSGTDNEIEIQTGVRFSYDKDKNVLCCDITILGSQLKKPLVKAEQCCYFQIKKESVKTLEKDGKYIFETPILIQFASLNYGALRGAINLKTLGTDLNCLILPPIYFSSIIDTPFTVKY